MLLLTPSCLPGASLSQTTCSHAYFAHHCDEDDEDDENENEDDGGAIANYAFFSKGPPVAALVKDGDCSSDHVCNVVTC